VGCASGQRHGAVDPVRDMNLVDLKARVSRLDADEPVLHQADAVHAPADLAP
jgi:hypothetical protein